MKKPSLKTRSILGASGAVLSLVLAWIAGFDFNERGEKSFTVALFTIVAFVVGAICPMFDDDL